MIKVEDLIPGTTAKYGIEFESIILDKSKNDYICITDNRLYDTDLKVEVSDNLREFISDFNLVDVFVYHTSLECKRSGGEYKRIEFASRAFLPSVRKPSNVFENLGLLIDAFSQWTSGKYYLPDHGTIAYFNEWNKKVMTTVTGGTHITISLPMINGYDNPIRWKVFMWLFTGLVTMYQPMYIALNGAPSPFTMGSERQRVSKSVVVGSTHIYDVFTEGSNRYEIFTHTPSQDYEIFDYPSYAHWYSKNVEYKGEPWRNTFKGDIGSSDIHRSDVFGLQDEFIEKELIRKEFYDSYKYFVGTIGSMTSNLIEFRFFDNEPIEYLLDKFNLLIRIADYAYDQSLIMEEGGGKEGLVGLLNSSVDKYLNMRMFVNKKSWHDAVVQSMKNGMDTKFSGGFINECYKAFELTSFASVLEKLGDIDISAKDLYKIFIDEMNTASHHFSEYFQTDDPKDMYSKLHQIEMYEKSVKKATEVEKEYLEKERIRKEERERILTNLKNAQYEEIRDIVIRNVVSLDRETKEIIDYSIDFDKLSEKLRSQIYEHNFDSKDIIRNVANTIEYSKSINVIFYNIEDKLDIIIKWFKESLVPMLEEEILLLKQRKEEQRIIEQQRREREQQRLEQERYSEGERLERERLERERVEEQTSKIRSIVLTNIYYHEYNLILSMIDIKKLTELLSDLIYIDNVDAMYLSSNASRSLYVSTFVSWNDISEETQNLLIRWFRESLIRDLVAYIPIPRVLETRINGGVIEHRHVSNDYWHRETTVHPNVSLSNLPVGHVVGDHTVLFAEDEESIPTADQMDDQAYLIQNVITNNVVNLTNTVMRDIINRTIFYDKLADKLQRWIYISHFGTKDIIDNMDLLIHHSLRRSIDNEPETYELLKMWIKDYLIYDLVRATPLQETRGLGALFE